MSDSESREETLLKALRNMQADKRQSFLVEACAAEAALRKRIEERLIAEGEPSVTNEPERKPSNESIRVELVEVFERAGSLIGPYRLLEQIGEGGCGVVYIAEQVEPVHRRVALKVIKPGMDTRQVLARFEAERQALALMDHPNIAKVFEAGSTTTGRPFFVMELVKGIRITDYCDERKLDTRRRLDLFIPVCQAIQHAHQKGIIHRDIKPSNILVSEHDGVPVPKVIDFGIAKATTDQPLTNKTLFTALEQFIGTPAYMSPEQAKLSGLDVDTRSDIYSLGVLLYELLTGKTPFDSHRLVEAGLDEIRRIIREEDPPRPSTRLSTLNSHEQTSIAIRHQLQLPKLANLLQGDLDWIVMKALEKDRNRRYETANGLLMDIQRHFQNEPVVARPPSQFYRLHKLVLRNKLVVGAGAAIAAVFLVGALVSSWQVIRATRAELKAHRAEANELQLRQEIVRPKWVGELKDVQSLEGLIDLPGRKCAILRVLPSSLIPPLELILQEGESEGGIQVLQIDSSTGVVKTRLGNSTTNPTVVLKLLGQMPRSGIALENAGIEPVLALYQEFTGRTLLRWPDLAERFYLISNAANNGDAAAALENALTTKQILAIPDGSKFIMVVPKSRAAAVKPRSAQLEPGTSKYMSDPELLPPGLLNFPNSNIWPVAAIYAELLGQKLDTTAEPGGRLGWVSFKNQTALSRQEAVYALETLFAWRGFKLMPVDENRVKLVPIAGSESSR